MNNDKMNMLKSYISVNVAPVLIDFASNINIPKSVIIPANCEAKELNGHYEGEDFLAPKWYYDLTNTNEAKIIMIKDIDSISKEEQLKFKELLEYRQVSTFKIPENTRIILTATNISKETINEEIYSLVAHI